jgi:hypothetical protein
MHSNKICQQKIRAVLLALCLMQLLNGCSTPEPLIVTKTEKEIVPDSLLVPCPTSDLEQKTYQGAIELALALKADLKECQKRLDDIRAWAQN